MSNVYNNESNLQILSDILGYGSYHSPTGCQLGLSSKLRLANQQTPLFLSADDCLIPSPTSSGMSPRQVLGMFVKQLSTLMQVQYGHSPLEYTLTGKPSAMAFEYAKGLLGQQYDHYMVGDSVEIDIKGGKK